jgi:hypothetical protein
MPEADGSAVFIVILTASRTSRGAATLSQIPRYSSSIPSTSPDLAWDSFIC